MSVEPGTAVGISAVEVVKLDEITATDVEFEEVLQLHLNDAGFSAYAKISYEDKMRDHWKHRNQTLLSNFCIARMLKQETALKISPNESELMYQRIWQEQLSRMSDRRTLTTRS